MRTEGNGLIAVVGVWEEWKGVGTSSPSVQNRFSALAAPPWRRRPFHTFHARPLSATGLVTTRHPYLKQNPTK